MTSTTGALEIKKRRKEEAEAAEQRRLDEARRERLRVTQEAHAKLIARLEAESGAWERAQRLRRYLRAVRRALKPGQRIEAQLEGQRVDLLALGEEFANQLDPLHSVPRTPGCFSGKDPYATGQSYDSDEAKLWKFVARSLGGDWRQGDKIGKQKEPSQPRSAGEWLFSAEDDA
jgi:hypothetical protein